MIYSFTRVKVPDLGGYVRTRNGVRYMYAYVGPRRRDAGGRSVHPSARMIGRIEKSEDGTDMLMPNERYYELTGATPPEGAVMEGAGRKPASKGRAREDRAEGSVISGGYGLAATALFVESGVFSSLLEALPFKHVRNLMGLAAYLCESQHSSFEGLGDFINGKMLFISEPSFDRRRAGDLLALLGPAARTAFYRSWIKAQAGSARHVFYDVTSFSTCSGRIVKSEFGCNREREQLRQINEGLFCCRETGLPLCMTTYSGSLNDARNFKHVLMHAGNCSLRPSRCGTVLIMDGGFSKEDFCWMHLAGWKFISGVSARRLSAVRQACASWSEGASSKDDRRAWTSGEGRYISSRIQLSLGGVDGWLVMCRDMRARIDQLDALDERVSKLRAELESTKRAPKDGFGIWARSFAPAFKVAKSAGPKGFAYEEDGGWLDTETALCGCVALFTTCGDMSDQEIMKAYRAKESVEDCFDTTRNGLSDKRLHVHGDQAAEGRAFAMFVALILWRLIRSRTKEWQKDHGSTVEGAITELEKIEFVKTAGGWRLKDAVTKRQRDLLKALRLDLSFMKEIESAG